MQRRRIVAGALLLSLGGLLWLLSARTHWEPVTRYTPPSMEALTNPFYAELALLRELGVSARVSSASESLPATSSAVLLYEWNWDASPALRERLKLWVRDGGRLIVDRTLTQGGDFERWSGLELIESRPQEDDSGIGESQGEAATDEDPDCEDLHDRAVAGQAGALRVCSPWTRSAYWRDTHGASWSLDAASGSQLRRYPRGAGSVTGINGYPWQLRTLFEADHALLLARALQLRRGDSVLFVRGDRSPSLLRLAWNHGAPVLWLGLATVALAIWRATQRFGPLLSPAPLARRSLREQIAGTAEFLHRHGGTFDLWRATVAALDQELARHLPLLHPLSDGQRLQSLGALTGLPPWRLSEALGAQPDWRPERLVRAITVLEGLRRRLRDRNLPTTWGTP